MRSSRIMYMYITIPGDNAYSIIITELCREVYLETIKMTFRKDRREEIIFLSLQKLINIIIIMNNNKN